MAENYDVEEDNTFEEAAAFMPQLVGKINENDLMYLYARFKQATIGPCNTSKPRVFDFKDKKKWSAWKGLGDMACDQAKREYVLKVRDCAPEWDSKKSQKTVMGPAVSRFAFPETGDNEINPDEDIFFQLCREGIYENFTQANCEDYSIRDIEQRTLLHWACDRGHFDIVKFLLGKGCDVNAQDLELLTPLHYAAMCGHKNITEILLQNGADPNLKDDFGDTPAESDVVSEEIKNMIRAAAASGAC